MRCMCDVCAAHEELVAASKQFRRSCGEKSTRLGLVALTVGPVYIRIRASKERASEGSVCGCAIAATFIYLFIYYLGWSLLETREAKLTWGEEIGSS